MSVQPKTYLFGSDADLVDRVGILSAVPDRDFDLIALLDDLLCCVFLSALNAVQCSRTELKMPVLCTHR